MAQVIAMDDIDFSAYLEETEAKQKVKPASVFVEDLLDWMYTPNAEQLAYIRRGPSAAISSPSVRHLNDKSRLQVRHR